MKHASHHLRRAHRGVAYGLIALSGLILILIILDAHTDAAFERERARLLETELERSR